MVAGVRSVAFVLLVSSSIALGVAPSADAGCHGSWTGCLRECRMDDDTATREQDCAVGVLNGVDIVGVAEEDGSLEEGMGSSVSDDGRVVFEFRWATSNGQAPVGQLPVQLTVQFRPAKVAWDGKSSDALTMSPASSDVQRREFDFTVDEDADASPAPSGTTSSPPTGNGSGTTAPRVAKPGGGSGHVHIPFVIIADAGTPNEQRLEGVFTYGGDETHDALGWDDGLGRYWPMLLLALLVGVVLGLLFAKMKAAPVGPVRGPLQA